MTHAAGAGYRQGDTRGEAAGGGDVEKVDGSVSGGMGEAEGGIGDAW